jgi:hypothetical protein
LATVIGNTVNVDGALPDYERQQSVYDSGCCSLDIPTAMPLLLPIINISATCEGNMVNIVVVKPKNECQHSVNDFGYCV